MPRAMRSPRSASAQPKLSRRGAASRICGYEPEHGPGRAEALKRGERDLPLPRRGVPHSASTPAVARCATAPPVQHSGDQSRSATYTATAARASAQETNSLALASIQERLPLSISHNDKSSSATKRGPARQVAATVRKWPIRIQTAIAILSATALTSWALPLSRLPPPGSPPTVSATPPRRTPAAPARCARPTP